MQHNRLIQPVLLAQPLGEIGEKARVAWPQLDRPATVPLGLKKPAAASERETEQVVRVRIIGQGLEQAATAALG
jgi:hypothetical protein